jgi:hypothetical protein
MKFVYNNLDDTYPYIAKYLLNIENYPNLCSDNYLKHPYSIYIDSLNLIARRTIKVIRVLNSNFDLDDLSDDVDNMLDAYMEHYDDILNIIKIIFAENPSEKIKKVKDKYMKEIKKIRDPLGQIVNKIKHDHRRVKVFEINGDNQNKYYGFYIEGVDNNGMVVPDEMVHKSFKGMRTAFSFARFLRSLIVDVFHLSGIMTALFKEIFRSNSRLDIEINAQSVKKFQEMISCISKFDEYFFIDEAIISIPYIRIGKKIEIGREIASYRKIIPSGRINLQISPDEHKRSFGFIYWLPN